MSSTFWMLDVGSRDLSQAEKEITSCKPCKAEQLLKMTTKGQLISIAFLLVPNPSEKTNERLLPSKRQPK